MSTKKEKETKQKNGVRKKPGAGGEGDFFHVEVKASDEFETFRTQDVGKKGGLERVAGKRKDGSWDTVKWLISKDMAHESGGKLIADHEDANDLLKEFESQPKKVEGDRFSVKAGSK
ncbi:MAG: hypothetical protein R2681_14780 [Pyrinomonadaceae bacterium]